MDERVGSLFELLDHLIDFAFGLSHAVVELFVQPACEPLLPLGDIPLPALQRRGRFVHGAAIALKPRAVGFERPGLRIDAREMGSQPLLVIAEKSACRSDHRQRHSQPLCDLDRQAPARRAVYQAVGRCKGLRIECKSCRDDAIGRAERFAVTAYLSSLGGPMPGPRRKVSEGELQRSLSNGQRLYLTAGCAACHGELTRGPVREADPDAEESLRVLELRDRAPSTPGALERAGVRFALYSDGVEKPEDATANLRKAVAAGLSRDKAVSALTLDAASIFGLEDRLGSLEPGKIANFFVANGDVFDEGTKIETVFVDGKKFEVGGDE